MNYTVRLSPHAQRSLDRLHGKTFELVSLSVSGLRENPRPRGTVKMKGRDNQWRIRAGTYRIIYEIDDDARIVRVLEIGHRGDVY